MHALTAGYALFLIVLLAMPLGGTRGHARAAANHKFLSIHRPASSRTLAKDLAINLAVFVPLGFLGVRSARRLGAPTAVAVAVVVGGSVVLSLTMECIQYYVPGRYSSLIDVAMNGLGAAGGGVVAIVRERVGG